MTEQQPTPQPSAPKPAAASTDKKVNDGTVPAEAMDFEEGEQNSVSTKVGTVGWPEGAENAPNTGPGEGEETEPAE